MTLEAKNCWRTCGRCDGYGCRDCHAGEVPCCPSCSESPDPDVVYTSALAEDWVDDVLAHGGNCSACMQAKKKDRNYADEMAALGFAIEVDDVAGFDRIVESDAREEAAHAAG